jgi:hypothetical protein
MITTGMIQCGKVDTKENNMYDMSQMQSWLQMMNQMKGQGGRGQNEWEAQQGEPNGSAMYQAQLAEQNNSPDYSNWMQNELMREQARKARAEAAVQEQIAQANRPRLEGSGRIGGAAYWYNPSAKSSSNAF